MVSKLEWALQFAKPGFRAVLFRMVSKQIPRLVTLWLGFRAVLFRMVSKRVEVESYTYSRFRAVLFRMVSKLL